MTAHLPNTKGRHRTVIYVGSAETDLIRNAVIEGGGSPTTDLSSATAAIWTGGNLSDLRNGIHPQLEWLQLPSAGVEKYAQYGVLDGRHTTTNASIAYAATVAEHALALLLSCARRLHVFSQQTEWTTLPINQLRGSTVAIVGCGRIGSALIDLLSPFDVTVLASTRSGRHVKGSSRTVAPEEHREILEAADFVVIAAPATPDTTRLIGAEELFAMKPTAFLVNISRGSLVDSDALVDAVTSGEIAGAALDVTDPEPLPEGHPMWAVDEILITPHTANPDAWDAQLLAPLVKENVARFLSHRPLLGIVDPDLGY